MRSIRVFAVAVFTCALAMGCSTTRQTSGGAVAGKTIASGSKILVMPVPDGIDKTEGQAGGSGAALTGAFRDTLMSHGYVPTVGTGASLEASIGEAQKMGFSYVLRGAITEWEDNVTEWSGNPDTAKVSVDLYEVATKETVGGSTHRMVGAPVDLFHRSVDRFAPELADRSLGEILGW